MTRDEDRREGSRKENATEYCLVRFPLRQPLLTSPLSFPLLRLLAHAGLLVKSTAFQLAEQTFTRQLLLGDFQSFFDVIIEDFDFHPFRLSTFSGYICLSHGPMY